MQLMIVQNGIPLYELEEGTILPKVTILQKNIKLPKNIRFTRIIGGIAIFQNFKSIKAGSYILVV